MCFKYLYPIFPLSHYWGIHGGLQTAAVCSTPIVYSNPIYNPILSCTGICKPTGLGHIQHRIGAGCHTTWSKEIYFTCVTRKPPLWGYSAWCNSGLVRMGTRIWPLEPVAQAGSTSPHPPRAWSTPKCTPWDCWVVYSVNKINSFFKSIHCLSKN